jgi:sugar PTS system EIIA component
LLNKLFGNKKLYEEVLSPLTGKVLGLEEVPDPVFSKRMIGDGIAILPTEGKVVSPVMGKVIQVFPTKHAVGIESKNGAEILIHIGLETVALNGEHFKTHVVAGQSINPGDLLVTFDLEEVEKKAKSLITPVIITNGEKLEQVNKHEGIDAVIGQTKVMDYQVKK